jgi:cardiolipin synthase
MTLFVYDRAFTARVRELQQDYLLKCIPRDLESFQNRPLRERLMENIALLVGPLL